jgi:hypothetical protein
MPIRLGPERAAANAVEVDASDGEALFELLTATVRRMSTGEQIEVVTALQSGGWSALRPELQERFDAVADAYLEGES